MEKGIRYYYEVKSENKIYYLDDKTGEFGSCLVNMKDLKYKYFHLFKDDEQNNDGLILFKEKFKRWNAELIKCGIKYDKYFNHYSATELTFKRFSASSDTLINNQFEEVSFDEFLFAEDSFNGGMIYLHPKCEFLTTPLDSYGYDYSSFYPHILINEQLKIPTKQGKKVKFDFLDYNDLPFGIYKVKIVCDNPDFNKIFAYSKKNTYTHYSLQFAHKFSSIFKVGMELLHHEERNKKLVELEHNAIVYNNEDLVNSRDIFYNWFDKLYNQAKQKCSKDNYLTKRLLSSLWGSLVKCDKKYFNDTQMECEDGSNEYKVLTEKYHYEDGEMITRYECVKKAKPYKYHYARMKPYLLALSRNVVGDLIMKADLLKHIIRINTDGIVIDKPYDFTALNIPYYPKPEEKTTGKIIWKNVNLYEKI